MKKFSIGALALTLLIFPFACKTAAPQGRPVEAINASDSNFALSQLQGLFTSEGSLSTLARVSIPGNTERRSFRARIVADRQGQLFVDVLTPLGTSAFSLYADNTAATIVNRSAKWYWSGPFTKLATRLGIPPNLSAGDFGRAVFGLPPAEELHLSGAPTDGGAIYSNSIGFFDVTSKGFRQMRWVMDPQTGVTAEVATFDPPSFPPKHVAFSYEMTKGGSTQLLELEHLAIEAGGTIEKPQLGSDYRQITDLSQLFDDIR
jgi:hypothetical protein